jgi:hypothetical protein
MELTRVAKFTPLSGFHWANKKRTWHNISMALEVG